MNATAEKLLSLAAQRANLPEATVLSEVESLDGDGENHWRVYVRDEFTELWATMSLESRLVVFMWASESHANDYADFLDY